MASAAAVLCGWSGFHLAGGLRLLLSLCGIILALTWIPKKADDLCACTVTEVGRQQHVWYDPTDCGSFGSSNPCNSTSCIVENCQWIGLGNLGTCKDEGVKDFAEAYHNYFVLLGIATNLVLAGVSALHLVQPRKQSGCITGAIIACDIVGAVSCFISIIFGSMVLMMMKHSDACGTEWSMDYCAAAGLSPFYGSDVQKLCEDTTDFLTITTVFNAATFVVLLYSSCLGCCACLGYGHFTPLLGAPVSTGSEKDKGKETKSLSV